MTQSKQLTTIGRAEVIQLLDYDNVSVVAKIDTGADLSSISASNISEQNGVLTFTLFYPGQSGYSGESMVVPTGEYSKTRIANSFGQREIRYVVKLRLKLKDRVVRATFSLSDRSDKLYPILIGRKLLKNKFLVDVAQGDPLHQQEKARKRNLLQELHTTDGSMEPEL